MSRVEFHKGDHLRLARLAIVWTAAAAISSGIFFHSEPSLATVAWLFTAVICCTTAARTWTAWFRMRRLDRETERFCADWNARMDAIEAKASAAEKTQS